MQRNADDTAIWSVLDRICDPEIPVLSITDMGIVREVVKENKQVTIRITSTYSGCPAMDMISATIKMELLAAGYGPVTVEQVISPAWTTDWMTATGKEKLKAYGIAPPNPRQQVCRDELFAQDEAVQCPHCESWHTRRISEFGSTACKALYQCNDCKEPFDYFKCH